MPAQQLQGIAAAAKVAADQGEALARQAESFARQAQDQIDLQGVWQGNLARNLTDAQAAFTAVGGVLSTAAH
jgi:hypothetical protein